jgi:RNA polymerase sigma-70 factor (ECF subfamily)
LKQASIRYSWSISSSDRSCIESEIGFQQFVVIHSIPNHTSDTCILATINCNLIALLSIFVISFNDIFEAHNDAVFRLALRYVNSAEDAEDIAQEVFVSVYFGLENFDRRSKLSTWIYRITVNKCLDHLKARKRKKRWGRVILLFGVSGEEQVAGDSAKSADSEMLEREFDDWVMQAIAGLPDNQHTAVVLTHLEGRPQAEVAEIMGLSVKAPLYP